MRTGTLFCLQTLGETATDNKSVHFFPTRKGQVSFFSRIQTSVTVILGGIAVLLLVEIKDSPDYFLFL